MFKCGKCAWIDYTSSSSDGFTINIIKLFHGNMIWRVHFHQLSRVPLVEKPLKEDKSTLFFPIHFIHFLNDSYGVWLHHTEMWTTSTRHNHLFYFGSHKNLIFIRCDNAEGRANRTRKINSVCMCVGNERSGNNELSTFAVAVAASTQKLDWRAIAKKS